MYCAHCGKPMDPDSRFCASCGTAAQAFAAAPMPRPLMRPRNGRFIAGICAGFAVAYGWDVTLVRVLTLVLLLCSAGTVALAYFALWIILPEAPYALTDHAHNSTTGTVA